MAYLVRFASNPRDLDAGFDLRYAVFHDEQQVARALDRDALDYNADHVVAYDDAGRCVGTGRLVRLDTRSAQIGRQATTPDHRRKGVGSAVLEALERLASLRGVTELVVHAQLHAEPFYRDRGYVTDGPQFQEHGVPHVRMRKVVAA